MRAKKLLTQVTVSAIALTLSGIPTTASLIGVQFIPDAQAKEDPAGKDSINPDTTATGTGTGAGGMGGRGPRDSRTGSYTPDGVNPDDKYDPVNNRGGFNSSQLASRSEETDPETVCKRVEEAKNGSVIVTVSDKGKRSSQKVDLKAVCPKTGVHPHRQIASYCALRALEQSSQLTAYCLARKQSKTASKNSKLLAIINASAAGVCWTEYFLAKASAAAAGGAGTFLFKSKRPLACGIAAIAAAGTEIGFAIKSINDASAARNPQFYLEENEQGAKGVKEASGKSTANIINQASNLAAMGISVTALYKAICLVAGGGGSGLRCQGNLNNRAPASKSGAGASLLPQRKAPYWNRDELIRETIAIEIIANARPVKKENATQIDWAIMDLLSSALSNILIQEAEAAGGDFGGGGAGDSYTTCHDDAVTMSRIVAPLKMANESVDRFKAAYPNGANVKTLAQTALNQKPTLANYGPRGIGVQKLMAGSLKSCQKNSEFMAYYNSLNNHVPRANAHLASNVFSLATKVGAVETSPTRSFQPKQEDDQAQATGTTPQKQNGSSSSSSSTAKPTAADNEYNALGSLGFNLKTRIFEQRSKMNAIADEAYTASNFNTIQVQLNNIGEDLNGSQIAYSQRVDAFASKYPNDSRKSGLKNDRDAVATLYNTLVFDSKQKYARATNKPISGKTEVTELDTNVDPNALADKIKPYAEQVAGNGAGSTNTYAQEAERYTKLAEEASKAGDAKLAQENYQKAAEFQELANKSVKTGGDTKVPPQADKTNTTASGKSSTTTEKEKQTKLAEDYEKEAEEAEKRAEENPEDAPLHQQAAEEAKQKAKDARAKANGTTGDTGKQVADKGTENGQTTEPNKTTVKTETPGTIQDVKKELGLNGNPKTREEAIQMAMKENNFTREDATKAVDKAITQNNVKLNEAQEAMAEAKRNAEQRAEDAKKAAEQKITNNNNNHFQNQNDAVRELAIMFTGLAILRGYTWVRAEKIKDDLSDTLTSVMKPQTAGTSAVDGGGSTESNQKIGGTGTGTTGDGTGGGGDTTGDGTGAGGSGGGALAGGGSGGSGTDEDDGLKFDPSVLEGGSIDGIALKNTELGKATNGIVNSLDSRRVNSALKSRGIDGLKDIMNEAANKTAAYHGVGRPSASQMGAMDAGFSSLAAALDKAQPLSTPALLGNNNDQNHSPSRGSGGGSPSLGGSDLGFGGGAGSDPLAGDLQVGRVPAAAPGEPDVFHADTPFNLFQIVSHRINKVSTRVESNSRTPSSVKRPSVSSSSTRYKPSSPTRRPTTNSRR